MVRRRHSLATQLQLAKRARWVSRRAGCVARWNSERHLVPLLDLINCAEGPDPTAVHSTSLDSSVRPQPLAAVTCVAIRPKTRRGGGR